MTSHNIRILVNGERRQVPDGWSVDRLLQELGRDPRTVAIEHNGSIIRRTHYGETNLCEGDRLELVQFVQGG